MKILVISGPTGCGKTTLSRNICKKTKNSIILSTDNYYKTGKLSNLFSKFIDSYFDRKISLNHGLLKKDINFIVENGISEHTYSYDFCNKTIKKSEEIKTSIKLLIVEGIFSMEFLKNKSNIKPFFIELKTNKTDCMNRAIDRDIKERGKTKEIAKRDFLKSWDLYHKKNKKSNNDLYELEYSTSTELNFLLQKLNKINT